jgi:quercetin dioxygenase-like cupin family protein
MNYYMIGKHNESEYVEMAEGIRRRTLAHGDKTVLCEFSFKKGAVIPVHRHLYEQTGYLISGKLLFTINGDEHEVNPGDGWCIKANVEHSAQIQEDTVLVEVFSPVREDYL